jgi:hypothetical protein
MIIPTAKAAQTTRRGLVIIELNEFISAASPLKPSSTIRAAASRQFCFDG